MSNIPCTERQRLVEIKNPETGQVLGTTIVPAEHDWRMFTREPVYEVFHVVMDKLTGYRELWYCIKCRHEETRVVPDAR